MNKYTIKQHFYYNRKKDQFGISLLITKKSKNKRAITKTRFISSYLLKHANDNYYRNYVTKDVQQIHWIREASFLVGKLYSTHCTLEDIIKEVGLTANEVLALYNGLNNPDLFICNVSPKLYFTTSIIFATGIRKILLVIYRNEIDKCKVLTGYYSTLNNLFTFDHTDALVKESLECILRDSRITNLSTLPPTLPLPLLER